MATLDGTRSVPTALIEIRSPMTSYAIIPAAGRSKRMGSPKLLLPWGGSTIIGQVLDRWRSSHVDRILVVVHPDDQELASRCQGQRTTIVMPRTAPPEMKDSVAAALRHIEGTYSPSDDDYWLLAPADMPDLPVAVIDRLLAEQVQSPDVGRTSNPSD